MGIDSIDYEISIHAPLTGSDRDTRQHMHLTNNFNPRSPYGERQQLHPK